MNIAKVLVLKYLARPSVSLKANATNIKISMQVKNLTSVEMPLQYMCHINHHYVDKGEFKANNTRWSF